MQLFRTVQDPAAQRSQTGSRGPPAMQAAIQPALKMPQTVHWAGMVVGTCTPRAFRVIASLAVSSVEAGAAETRPAAAERIARTVVERILVLSLFGLCV